MGELACAVCLKKCELKCSACGKVAYCSSQHQRQDWKNHKLHCVLYKISTNEKVGRHLVTTRDIEEGTILLIEKPLIMGPKFYSLPLCLGCCETVDGSYFCSGCGFPMCSLNCTEKSIHKDNECQIFGVKGSSPKKISNYNCPQALYQSILPLRCLLLTKNSPDSWKLLNTMESHQKIRESSSEVWNENQVNIVNFLRDWHGLASQFTIDDVNRVIGFIEVNSFQIKTMRKLEYSGLYRLGALMSHDCRPNTHHAFTADGNLVIRSSIKIPKNTQITMSYVDPMAGTMERRRNLQLSKYFSCDCLRCSDPMEFQTFFSGIKCWTCGEGYLLPKNSLEASSPWICYSFQLGGRNMICQNLVTPQTIERKLSESSALLDSLVQSEGSISKLEQILNQATKFLHPNHYLLIPLKRHLNQLYHIQCIDNSNKQKNEIQDLEKCKSIAQELLQLYNVLDPGLTRRRGLLFRQISILDKGLRDTKNSKINSKEIENEEELTKFLEKLFELDELVGLPSTLNQKIC